jgi:hypothetical protein
LTLAELHTTGAFAVLVLQFIALWLSRPYLTFALRSPVIVVSVLISASLILSLVINATVVSAALLSLAAALCVAVIAFPRFRRATARRRMRSMQNALKLHPPFAGRWRVTASGPDPLLNHHLIASDQVYACDFLHGQQSFGQPVLAPGGGIVVDLRDGVPDRTPSSNPDDPSVRGLSFGNYIALEIDHRYVFLCHLRNGSIGVKPGDHVASRQPLAQCGNSGRTTGAHLHVHAQMTPEPDPFVAQGVPIAFRVADGTFQPMITGDWLVSDSGLP